MPDSYGINFWGVSRRGLRMWDVTTIPRAFRIETVNSMRRGRYAPDMWSLGFVKFFTSGVEREKGTRAGVRVSTGGR